VWPFALALLRPLHVQGARKAQRKNSGAEQTGKETWLQLRFETARPTNFLAAVHDHFGVCF